MEHMFKMEKDKLHFNHAMLYKFKKGVCIVHASKHIQYVYLDRASAVSTIKKWFC